MQVVDNFLQVLLRLFLARDIGELDAGLARDIDLGVALAHVEHHAVPAKVLHHPAVQHPSEEIEDGDREYPGKQEVGEGGQLLDNLAGEGDVCVVQAFHQVRVVHQPGLVEIAILIRKDNLVRLQLDLVDLVVFRHGHEGAVVDLPDTWSDHLREHQEVEQENQEKSQKVII